MLILQGVLPLGGIAVRWEKQARPILRPNASISPKL